MEPLQKVEMRKTPLEAGIHSIGHANETLFVRLNTGTVFSYQGVPKSEFLALCKAEDKSGHIVMKIESSMHYRFSRLTENTQVEFTYRKTQLPKATADQRWSW